MTERDDLIEAMAKAIYETSWGTGDWPALKVSQLERDEAREQARAALSAVAPLIRAAALEEAAKVAEGYCSTDDEFRGRTLVGRRVLALEHRVEIAAAIRALGDSHPPGTKL